MVPAAVETALRSRSDGVRRRRLDIPEVALTCLSDARAPLSRTGLLRKDREVGAAATGIEATVGVERWNDADCAREGRRSPPYHAQLGRVSADAAEFGVVQVEIVGDRLVPELFVPLLHGRLCERSCSHEEGCGCQKNSRHRLGLLGTPFSANEEAPVNIFLETRPGAATALSHAPNGRVAY